MSATGRSEKPIWAKWRLGEDGRVTVVATYAERGAYVQRETVYRSIEEAVEALGESFRDVVIRATGAGSQAGRWRP